METRFEGRQYGYLHEGNDGVFVRNIPWQQVGGYSVGVVHIQNTSYPFMPGNVVNACTYDFPVRMRAVEGLDTQQVFDADPSIVDNIIAAARHMVEKEGVRAICSACGFFGNYHKKVAEALPVPTAMSSLVQIPMIRATLRPGQKIGIMTATAKSLTESLLSECGIETGLEGLVVQDTQHTKNFSCVCDNRGYWDNEAARNEILDCARELVSKDDNIGAILLECSDMPPYASAVQALTQLPVFDFIGLIKWLHHSVNQKPYSGWI
jgi:Asp/Glu/hydantoin racemase